jgi:chain length determinant protein (polysaccharide antigen chain regulator)
MPNSPEQSQAYNDEIDLADLIRALWQGKWLVIGVTLATLALGIAYLMIAPKSYTASLNILALPNSQADVYIELHEAQLIATDKQSLLALFVEDLKTQTQTQTQSSNDLELSIASVTPTQSRLSFPTQAPGQLTETVADALELANQNVNQQLELILLRHSDKLVRNNTNAIEALDLERLQKIAIFKVNQSQQVATLKEQVKLARFLSIEKGVLSSLTGFRALKVYEQGYLALEKEIELIQSRKVEDFIPDLARIEFLQAELLKNKEVKSVEMMLAKTPIGSDQFAAAVYNLDTLVYKNNTKTSLILALSIVLGGMLGIFVLLIRNVLIKQD